MALADETDLTIAAIKDIGKLFLLNNLSIDEREKLNNLLSGYKDTISVIIQRQSSSIDVSDPAKKRFLLCALQIHQICRYETTLVKNTN